MALDRAQSSRAIGCDRSGAFTVVEPWLEDRVLVEALDGANAARVAGLLQGEVLAKLIGASEPVLA